MEYALTLTRDEDTFLFLEAFCIPVTQVVFFYISFLF